MSTESNGADQLIRDIFSTSEAEIQCDEAIYHLARAAAQQLDETAFATQFGALKQHLAFCTNCREEFALLQELAQEEAGQAITAPYAPPLPENGRFPVWERAKNLLNIQFPGFAPLLGTALSRGEELGFEPTAVSLPETSFTLELDVGISEMDASERELFITLLADNAEAIEGSSLWLHRDINGPVIQEQALNALGDVTFTQLQPGTYALRLFLADRHYAISAIQLP